MNKHKKLLFTIGLGLLAIITFLLIYFFVGKDEFQLDPKNISVFEDDESTFYLKKAPENLALQIFVGEPEVNDFSYNLTDESGEEITAQVKQIKEGLYEISAPKSGYAKGNRYELELGPGVYFYNEDLLHARSLVFAIERDPIEHYKFTDQVIELDGKVNQVAEDIIEVEDNDLVVDDIVFGLDKNDDYVVYKIEEILNDGTLQVTIPAIDEIYSELEVYGDYEFDFTEIITNPDIEASVIDNLKSSSFFSLLTSSAYAEGDDFGKVDIELEYTADPKTNSIEFKVIITLKAGEDGLFGKKSLKHHEVKITLMNELGTRANLDIDNVRNWDVSASRSESFAWEVDINYQPPKIDESIALSELFKEDKEEDVWEIVKLLNEMVSDELKQEITLFEQGVPVSGIPGLILTIQVNIVGAFELQANLNFSNDYSTMTTIGLMYRHSEFKPYFNSQYNTSGGRASFKGEIKSKVGVNFEIKTTLFHDKVAFMSLKPEVGLYADAYIALTVQSDKLDPKNTYGYFESGTYLTAEVNGHLNLLFEKHDFKSEIEEIRHKFDHLSFGDYKVVGGLDTEKSTLYARDFLATPDEFTFNYYDIRAEEEISLTLEPEALNYSLENGDTLDFKDGKIILPKTSAEELIIKASYTDDSKKVYFKDLVVYISDNRQGGFIDHEEFEEPMLLTFASGAGAWLTTLELDRDGSFTGIYTDSNAGQSGDGYLSTIYISEFTGQFDEIERIDEDTYSMKLVELNYKYEEGEEWIEDQTNHIATYAYGLEKGEDFFFYSPYKDKRNFSMDFLSWGAYSLYPENKLGHWALHNLETDYGFFSEIYFDQSEQDSVETSVEPENAMLTSFEDINFDANYGGPGSEFIGTWYPVYDAPIDFMVVYWEINYKDGIFYIKSDLAGDPKVILLTAEYKDGKLHSENGTQINIMDYVDPETQDLDLPESVEAGHEKSQFSIEDGYLQWISEDRGDLSDFLPPDANFKGYEKR